MPNFLSYLYITTRITYKKGLEHRDAQFLIISIYITTRIIYKKGLKHRDAQFLILSYK